MLVMEAYDVKYYQVAGLSSRESQLTTSLQMCRRALTENSSASCCNCWGERFHMTRAANASV
jgi:hypothetical protein